MANRTRIIQVRVTDEEHAAIVGGCVQPCPDCTDGERPCTHKHCNGVHTCRTCRGKGVVAIPLSTFVRESALAAAQANSAPPTPTG